MAIGFDDIARGANVNRPGGAPKAGDVWRVELCRVNIDHKAGGKADETEGEYTVWSPTGTWFHRPWMFGRLVFVDAPSSHD
jgi:hypothetical protein